MSIEIKAVKPCMDGDSFDLSKQIDKVQEEVTEMRFAAEEKGGKGRAHLAEETVDVLVAIYTQMCSVFTYDEMVAAVKMVNAKNFLRGYGEVTDWTFSKDCHGKGIVPTLTLSCSGMKADESGT